MLHIKVWCLPKESEERLKMLFYVLVRSLVTVPELCIKSERDVLINFPTDAMQFGLGTEIMVEVSGIDKNLALTPRVRSEVAKMLGLIIESWYPDAITTVRMDPPVSMELDGGWTSKKPTLDVSGIGAMPVLKFFSDDRFLNHTDDTKLVRRANSAVYALAEYDSRKREEVQFANMAEFAAHYTEQQAFERTPNCGAKTAQLIGDVMRASGFDIK